jgi:hemoglobin
MSMGDIRTHDDVVALIEAFYGEAFEDDLLGPVFVDVARMDLAEHMPVMCQFWETVLFRAGTYKRNALTVHVDLHERAALTPEHFGRWVDLWHATVDSRYAGPTAELAKVQGSRIAWSMSRRLMGESGSEFVTIRRATL